MGRNGGAEGNDCGPECGGGTEFVLEPGVPQKVAWCRADDHFDRNFSQIYETRGCTDIQAGIDVFGRNFGRLDFQLQGSHDKANWHFVREVGLSSAGTSRLFVEGVDFPYVRVRRAGVLYAGSSCALAATLTGFRTKGRK